MYILIDLLGDDDLIIENEPKKKKEKQKLLPVSNKLRKQVININGKIVEI